jgi:type II secretory pathway pseudopilin PulG
MHIVKRKKGQSGDTIVEVLIATAIIGLVMTVSYATAQRSVLVGRRAQERVEGLKVAESQVEILKSLAPLASPNIFDASAASPTNPTFCVTPTSIINGGCAEGPGNRYNKSITRTDMAVTNESTFTVRVFWDRIGGGQDDVTLVYRIHRGQYNK